MTKIILAAISFVLILSLEVNAQVYRYTDKEGNTVFTDSSTKAAGQKDSEKISNGSMSTWSYTETESPENLCYKPTPILITGTGAVYDGKEQMAFQDCIRRGGKKMPRKNSP